jgi:hypothetical protein
MTIIFAPLIGAIPWLDVSTAITNSLVMIQMNALWVSSALTLSA